MRGTHMSILSLTLPHYKSPLQRSIFQNARLPNHHPTLRFLHKAEIFTIWKTGSKMKAADRGAIVEDGFVYKEETHLTVLKTSLFFAGDGFTVYDCQGEVVFRVDSYSPDKAELVLMDPNGRCLLTVRRKRPSLHQRWEGFLGEKTEGQKPIFSVRRSSLIGRSSGSMTVEMYGGELGGEEYQIEGSFAQRTCTIYDAERESVAEIRRKVDASTNVVLGMDVFTLCVKPAFDGAFAMGLVIVLDQINGDDIADDAAEDHSL